MSHLLHRMRSGQSVSSALCCSLWRALCCDILRLGLPVSRLVINSLINRHTAMHKFIIILPVQCHPQDPGLMAGYVTVGLLSMTCPFFSNIVISKRPQVLFLKYR